MGPSFAPHVLSFSVNTQEWNEARMKCWNVDHIITSSLNITEDNTMLSLLKMFHGFSFISLSDTGYSLFVVYVHGLAVNMYNC